MLVQRRNAVLAYKTYSVERYGRRPSIGRRRMRALRDKEGSWREHGRFFVPEIDGCSDIYWGFAQPYRSHIAVAASRYAPTPNS